MRVRIPFGAPQSALLVPEQAIGSDQGGRYVLVVDRDNTVAQRRVAIGPKENDARIIESGLDAQDRVVVAGTLRAIPGQKVEPQMQAADAVASAAADTAGQK